MSTPNPSSPSSTPGTAGDDQRQESSSTVWKVLTAVFAVAAVGLGIWAFTLNNDAQAGEDQASSALATLEADNEELAAQVATLEEEKSTLEDEKATLEEQVGQQSSEAQQAIDDAVAGLGIPAGALQVTDQQVSDAVAALDAATGALATVEGDVETAQAQRDQAAALAETAQLCAGGSANATSLLGDGDVDGAAASLNTVAPACQAAFAEENQPQQ